MSDWEHVPGLGWLAAGELTARAAAATGPRGLDYSAGPISGSAIRKAGYDFVIRYVDDPALGLRPKHCRAAEYADLVAAGLDVWLVFEQAVTDMLGGYGAGVANARRAQAGARALGHQGPIFMACDMHLAAAQIPTALQYIRGAESVLGHDAAGVYGFWELIDAAITAGVGSAYWQAGIAPAPTDPVHIWQRNDGFVTVGGIQCDVNVLLRPIPGGDDLTPEQEAKLDLIEGFCTAIYQQMSGSTALGEWAGWPSFPEGSGYSLTVVDYLRQADVQLQALSRLTPAQRALSATQTPAQDEPGLSAADVDRIASALMGKLLAGHRDQV